MVKPSPKTILLIVPALCALVLGCGPLCKEGQTQQGACGLNGRGTEPQTCTDATWVSTGACIDPDVCTDGAIGTVQVPCGIEGTKTEMCQGGQWSSFTFCSAPTALSIVAQTRKDMVFDGKRKRLYITTAGSGTGGEVKVYNLTTRQFETPLLTGGTYQGIDISPDEDTLLVADKAGVFVHKVDLTNGTSSRVDFTPDFGEASTYMVAFTSNTEALVDGTFNGSGWVPLRKVDLTTGVATTITTVRQNTMLSRSADGTVIAYAEANISSGDWGRYRISDQNIQSSTTGWFDYEIAVNRDATQYAVPTYNGTYIFDGTLTQVGRVGTYAGARPVGAVYSPVADELYFAWTGAEYTVDVYSTTTLQKLRTIDSRKDLVGSNGNSAFVDGRMRISRDGKYLSVTTGGTAAGTVFVYMTGQ